jgi:hypothetical protein
MTIETDIEEVKELLNTKSSSIETETIVKKISKIDKKITKLEEKIENTSQIESNLETKDMNISLIIEELALIEANIDAMINTGSIDKIVNEFVKFTTKLNLINIDNEKDYKINLEYI